MTLTSVPTSQHPQVPVMLGLVEAARLLGIGRSLAYEMVKTGEWPTPVLRFGRLIRVPSGPIQRLLVTGRVDDESSA